MRLRHSLVGAIAGGDRPSVLFRYSGGSGLGPQGYTFTRADATTCATYVDKNGVVQTVAANVLRDNHYVNGVRTTLLEGSRQNTALRSEAPSNVFWAVTRASIGGAAITDFRGASTANLKLIEDATAAATHQFGNNASFTVTANKQHSFSAFFKASERFRFRMQITQAGGSVNADFNLNTALVTATSVTGSGVISSSGITALGSTGWYRCWISGLCDAVNTALSTNIYLEDGTGATSYNGDGASGLYIDGFQLEQDGCAFPSSYIPTAASAVTRAADALSFPFQYAPQAMTVYADAYHYEATDATTNYTVAHVGTGSTTTPYFYSRIAGNTMQGETQTDPGSGGKFCDVGSVSFADRIELRSVLNADGSVVTGISANVASESVGTPSAAATLSTAWSAQTLTVGKLASGTQPGFFALRSLKIASGVQSLATCRATQGDLLNYTPGDAAAPGGGTFSRADASVCATYVDANGVVQTVGPNILRNNHYVNGVRTTLLEGSRQNSGIRSGDVSNAQWGKGNVTVGAATTDPSGGSSAYNIYPTTTGVNRSVFNTCTMTVAPWTVSVFAKANGMNWLALGKVDGTNTGVQWFNLSSGTLGTGPLASHTSGITSIGNGWYRCWIQTTAAAATQYLNCFVCDADNSLTATTSGTNGILFWGGQMELGAFPSSYIATGAAAVTRAADALSFPFSPVPQAMTCYADIIDLGAQASQSGLYLFGAASPTTAWAFLPYFSSATDVTFSHQPTAGRSNSSAVTTGVVYGDELETCGFLTSAGAPGGSISRNGGAATTATSGGATSFDAAWSAQTVRPATTNSGAFFGAIKKLVIASGVQSLATMRGL